MKVLFIDSVHPILEEQLTQYGYVCTNGTTWSRDEILNQVGIYQGVVIRSKFRIDAEFFNHATSLRFIARSGAGLENIQLDEAEKRNIIVFNSPEGNRDAVGEQATGMLLSLFNHLNRADQEVRKGVWKREENRGVELKGKTVGIIGYGNMGSAFAQRLQGFECRVIAYDKYKSTFQNNYAESVSLQHLMRYSDVISFHVPLTSETEFLVNNGFINSMDKPFYLINTARGKVVNTAHLVNGLKSGKILGAALDVLEYETSSFETILANELPEAFQYLVQSENVILSPHVAGWTVESYVKLSTFLAEKIIAQFGSF